MLWIFKKNQKTVFLCWNELSHDFTAASRRIHRCRVCKGAPSFLFFSLLFKELLFNVYIYICFLQGRSGNEFLPFLFVWESVLFFLHLKNYFFISVTASGLCCGLRVLQLWCADLVACSMGDLSSLTRDRTCVLCIARWILNTGTPRESLSFIFEG